MIIQGVPTIMYIFKRELYHNASLRFNTVLYQKMCTTGASNIVDCGGNKKEAFYCFSLGRMGVKKYPLPLVQKEADITETN